MDNCFLGTLKIKPGKLSPPFKKTITEYSSLVSSSVETVELDGFTDDSGASWLVKGSSSRCVELRDGINRIVAEVTSEDGKHRKEYEVSVKRLSSSLASVQTIKLSLGKTSIPIHPPFTKGIQIYYSTVKPWTHSLHIKCVKPESKTTVSVQGTNKAEVDVPLDLAQTTISIDVTSPNGVNSIVFTLYVTKEPVATPLLPKMLFDASLKSKLCVICGNLLHNPITFKHTISQCKQKSHFLCAHCFHVICKSAMVCPIDGGSMVDVIVEEVASTLSQELFDVIIECPYHMRGCKTSGSIKELVAHSGECSFRPIWVAAHSFAVSVSAMIDLDTTSTLSTTELEAKSGKDLATFACKQLCTSCTKCTKFILKSETDIAIHNITCQDILSVDLQHKMKESAWEKALRSSCMVSHRDEKGCIADVEECIKTYSKSSKAHFHDPSKISELRDSIKAALNIACSGIMAHPSNAELHFLMGMVFEESLFLENLYTEKTTESSNEYFDSEEDIALCLADQGSDCSKSDDINALCAQHGVEVGAPIASKLKVIDKEFHMLKNSGSYHRAEYVQTLYLFLSASTRSSSSSTLTSNSQNNTSASSSASRGEVSYHNLKLVLSKYLDACSLSSKHSKYYMHAGRVAQLMNEIPLAQACFAIATSLNPLSLYTRFKYCQLHNDVDDDLRIACFKEALLVANAFQEDFWTQRECIVANPFLHINTDILALYRTVAVSKSMSYLEAQSLLKGAISFTIRTLRLIGSKKSHTYTNLFKLLLEMYDALAIVEEKEGNKGICCSLSLFTLNLIPTSNDLSFVALRRCLARRCVLMSPCSSVPLVQLGWEFLRDFEERGEKEALSEAQLLFDAAWETTQTQCQGVPKALQQSQWWRGREGGSEDKISRKSPASSTTSKGIPRKSSLTSSKVPPPKRSSPRRTPPPKSANGSRPRKSATKLAPISKPLPSTSTTSSLRSSSSQKKIGRNPVSPKASHASEKLSISKATTNKQGKKENVAFLRTKPGQKQKPSAVKLEGKGNRALTQDRSQTATTTKPASKQQLVAIKLGLARVAVLRYGVKEEGMRQAVDEHYSFIIDQDPQNYDAYVDYGSFLEELDRAAAVALYDRFPYANEETPSFDDAFLHGEAVRHIMKLELYTHPTLPKHLVGLGRALGLRRIESYIDKLDQLGNFSNMLKEVYAAINHKSVDDKDLQPFFKFKCWI
eukprot:m.111703 g.111703  ORF g.111703 m.111703 type:complete len:1203 (-) comp9242_c0_seq7:719-4327(-)